jgi:hypothetical protein
MDASMKPLFRDDSGGVIDLPARPSGKTNARDFAAVVGGDSSIDYACPLVLSSRKRATKDSVLGRLIRRITGKGQR